jgi:hypothetical protein
VSGNLILYAIILVVAVAGLLVAYRLLGTPSRLQPTDYELVLEDVVASVDRAAQRLRAAIDSEPANSPKLEEVAREARKIFQTGYYQSLRLRPLSGPDIPAAARETLGQACEAYDWASRMVASESLSNPMILESAKGLIDRADSYLKQARQALSVTARPS